MIIQFLLLVVSQKWINCNKIHRCFVVATILLIQTDEEKKPCKYNIIIIILYIAFQQKRKGILLLLSLKSSVKSFPSFFTHFSDNYLPLRVLRWPFQHVPQFVSRHLQFYPAHLLTLVLVEHSLPSYLAHRSYIHLVFPGHPIFQSKMTRSSVTLRTLNCVLRRSYPLLKR